MLGRRLVVVALMLAAAGCADLQPMELGICGNGVLEDGEDCDLHPDPALGEGLGCGAQGEGGRACRYLCGAAGAPACPAGWACGADAICRHPTGTFAEATGSPWAVGGPSLALADFDGNGDLDVLSADRAGVAIHYGATPPQFGRTTELHVTSEGLPAAADLDGDGAADVILATGAGLVVLRGTTEQTLAPVAYSPLDLGDLPDHFVLDAITVVPELRNDRLIIVADLPELQSGIVSLDESGLQLPGGRSAAELVPPIPSGNFDDAILDPEEFALAFRGAEELYLYRVVLADLNGSAQLQPRDTLPLPGPILHGALFGDVDADGDLDILVSIDDGTEWGRVAVALGDVATGTIGAFAFDRRFDRLDASACSIDGWPGTQRWPIAVGQIGGGPGLDFVTHHGIVFDFQGGLCPIGAIDPGDPWREAVVADFNRDGFMDIASAREDEVVDFFLGDGGFTFTFSQVTLPGRPLQLSPGDYDGDGVTDLVLAARTDDGDELIALFGDGRAAPRESVTVGAFGSLERVLPFSAGYDRPEDLLFLSSSEPRGEGRRAAGFMYGTGDRYLISPFNLVDRGSGIENAPQAVVAGAFEGADPAPDLLALAPPNVWLLPNGGEARFEIGTARSYPIAGDAVGFRGGRALFAVADLDGDGRDEAIGLDGLNRARATELDAPTLLVVRVQDAGPPTYERVAVPEELGSPRSLGTADVDGDGELDVLAAFGGVISAEGGRTGTGGLVLFGGGGVPGGSGSLLLTAPAEVGSVQAVAALDADADPAPELVVLTELGVHVLELAAGAELQIPAVPVLPVQLTGAQLRVVDLDQDGLDDLLLDDGRGLRAFLSVPHVAR